MTTTAAVYPDVLDILEPPLEARQLEEVLGTLVIEGWPGYIPGEGYTASVQIPGRWLSYDVALPAGAELLSKIAAVRLARKAIARRVARDLAKRNAPSWRREILEALDRNYCESCGRA